MDNITKETIMSCIQGDKRAQTILFDSIKPILYRVILSNTKNNGETDILLSNTIQKIFNCLHQFKFEGSFAAWCIIIAKHSIADYYRREKKNNILSIDECFDRGMLSNMEMSMKTPSTFNLGLSILELEQKFSLIKRLLTPKEYTIFMLCYQGYTHKEIAQCLGTTEKTSRWHIFVARKKIINCKEITNK